ncbi:MAG TPA: hypothetical protein VFJ74_09655 [Gemmatimonadaceae bacterium]|nr:hypothetical protein [Gemmatimonadaceae bacterium]
MRFGGGALVGAALAAGLTFLASAPATGAGEIGLATRRAAGVVTVVGPADEPLRDAAPTFVVSTSGFAPDDPVVAVTLELSTRVDFAPPLLATASAGGAGATLRLDRPLPERATVYWRARARTASGAETLSDVVGPRTTPAWLVLLSPNSAGGSSVATRRPTFVWHSATVTTPPGPWRYDVTVTNVATGTSLVARGLADTTFTPSVDLEANTSYRWAVVARLASGDTTRVASVATFVIADDGVPPATILYQNFPNPFPAITASAAAAVANSAGVGATCFWFDLARPSVVRLDVYTLRGNHVRTLVPSGALQGVLAAGRYGRAPGAASANSGCDPRLAWDGTAADGRVVPAGIYLVRLVADQTSSVRKVVFRGR